MSGPIAGNAADSPAAAPAATKTESAGDHPGKLRAGILGASGYGGVELIVRLWSHPEVEVVAIGSRQYEQQPLAECWQSLQGLSSLAFQDTDAVIAASDVVFCATPHGATAPLVEQARRAGKRVVDLSADFRLPADTYADWYGPHPHPERISEAVYGLVELNRERLSGAPIVAAPGCNATAASLALAPLAPAGLIGGDVSVSIVTGVSGAGRATSQTFHYAELNENARAYKIAGDHRHTAEIEMTLGRLGAERRVTFSPHLVPMTRGILATCTTRPEAEVPSDGDLQDLYRDFYAHDPLIEVLAEPPQTKAVAGSDRAFVHVRRDRRSGMIVALGAIDNLGKGAAGQAIQAFNVAYGFPETAGLKLAGMWP